MKIRKDIKNLLIGKEEPIINALEKISENKIGAVLVTNSSGILEGIVTDGDIRRWIVSSECFRPEELCQSVMQKEFFHLNIHTDISKIKDSFSDKIKFIPLLDEYGLIKALALKDEQSIVIGQHVISNTEPCFIIAEIGNNHNGDVKLAYQLIDLAADAGADCVKFQMRSMNAMYRKIDTTEGSEDLGAEYTLDLLNRFQLKDKELFEAFDYCKKRNVIPMCTPWDHESLLKLERYGMQAYKVASADLTNEKLLKAISATGKPMICSTGMSDEKDIKSAICILSKNTSEFILLHCNSTYPAPFKDVNLNYLERLRSFEHVEIVGYSGHERGIEVPIAAVALGAKVIEKHFTIDRNMEGNDHRVSLLPAEFESMVTSIRNIEASMGTKNARQITQGELMNREVLGKSIIAKTRIQKGMTISSEMLEVRSPGKGLKPSQESLLIGLPAARNFNKGDFFYESDLSNLVTKPKNYVFSQPFGIPVRYHDINEMIGLSNVDFVEFHLSYNDLRLQPEKFLKKTGYNVNFTVHCPELFPSDHILDLASHDNAYRRESINYVQQTINVTRELRQFFKTDKKPIIVINAGGSTMNHFDNDERRFDGYKRVSESLSKIEDEGVIITFQTMPPFPWHFGGQRFHNLFMDANEIQQFCTHNDVKVTLDLSHSKLYCNYKGISFESFIKQILPHVAYLHVVDAKGIDGEGIQIGAGEIDFKSVSNVLKEALTPIPFIPEIWQGHKNNGEGFWQALEKLEALKF